MKSHENGNENNINNILNEYSHLWNNDCINLKKIDSNSIHRICSGQVIVDLESAIKELIENSIDANATSINIIINNGGFKCIQVTDNGKGISLPDYQSIALKHFTSKIRNFKDLQNGITSLGFRGEALSSLCALSSKLIIFTRTKDDKNAVSLKYDKNGQLIDISPTSHPIGTTVYVEDLFQPTPVRLENFIKKHRREYNKMIHLLQEYCIAHNYITFNVTGNTYSSNILSQRSQKVKNILNTTGNGNLKDAIISVYGSKQITYLDIFSYNSDNIKIKGYISKLDSECGRRVGDRQFLTLNGRPVDIPKINRIFNEIYRKSNPSKYPVFFLAINIKQGTYDINISPNKRCVMLENEKIILNEIREYISLFHWSMNEIILTQTPLSLVSSSKNENNKTLSQRSQSFSGRLNTIRNINTNSQSFSNILSKYSNTVEDIDDDFINNQNDKKIRKTSSSPILSIPTNMKYIRNTNKHKKNNQDNHLIHKITKNNTSIISNINTWSPTPKKYHQYNENRTLFLSQLHREIRGVDKLEEELDNLLQDNIISITDDHELINKYKYHFACVHDEKADSITITFSIEQIKEKNKEKTKI